jgi:predicted DNA-binding transcriptional regulator YafY
VSHDTDKLIRQLSLVAFLMAERRLLTARDVKSNVEGYSEMSDEAFARRFYSDRAELLALGVPLQSQRDEFTGEELYTLRSENYFLDRLDLKDDELAALQTALFYLDRASTQRPSGRRWVTISSSSTPRRRWRGSSSPRPETRFATSCTAKSTTSVSRNGWWKFAARPSLR